MRIAALLSSLVVVLPLWAASPAPAQAATPVQFEVLGLGSQYSGGSTFAGGHPVSDLYSTVFGFAGGVSLGFTDHLSAGYRVGLTRDEKDIGPDLALQRWSLRPGYSARSARSTTRIHRKLTTVSHHVLLQYHARFAGRFGFYDEFGAGVSSFTEKVEYFDARGTQFILASYQDNLTLLFGGGLTWDIRNVASLVAGLDVMLVPTRNGQIWSEGDNAQLVGVTLGVRYPRR